MLPSRSDPPPARAVRAAASIPPQTGVTVAPDNAPLNGSVRSPSMIPVPPVPALPRATHAGVVTRLIAAAVDSAAVVVLAVVLDLAAAGARFVWSPGDFRWPRLTIVSGGTALLAVAVVYLTAGWALAGRTYGAKLMGLRVLSSRHELLGWPRSVLRAVLCVIWPVGLLWSGVSRTRRSVADLVLRTVVVYDALPYTGPAASP
jgi:uncharacterized RDD family membrane protein YckC